MRIARILGPNTDRLLMDSTRPSPWLNSDSALYLVLIKYKLTLSTIEPRILALLINVAQITTAPQQLI
jgi:hypothetical protein